MSRELIIKNTIEIEAPPSKVWDTLVNPDQTKKYMFGCEALSDWKPGSPLLWKGVFDGKELIAVKGSVVNIRERKFLSYTVFDPNSTIEDLPENYTTVTYELTVADGQTILTVTQGDFATVAEGERRFKEATQDGGWQPVLTAIKKLAEKK